MSVFLLSPPECTDLDTSEVATSGSGTSDARWHKVWHIFTPSAETKFLIIWSAAIRDYAFYVIRPMFNHLARQVSLISYHLAEWCSYVRCIYFSHPSLAHLFLQRGRLADATVSLPYCSHAASLRFANCFLAPPLCLSVRPSVVMIYRRTQESGHKRAPDGATKCVLNTTNNSLVSLCSTIVSWMRKSIIFL